MVAIDIGTYAGCLHLVQQDKDGEQMRQVAYTHVGQRIAMASGHQPSNIPRMRKMFIIAVTNPNLLGLC